MELDPSVVEKAPPAAPVEVSRPTPVWELDGAPAGSTRDSLMVWERGEPVRVSGPTHYVHLADGRVLTHYAGGTHFTEPGPGGRDTVTRIVGVHEG